MNVRGNVIRNFALCLATNQTSQPFYLLLRMVLQCVVILYVEDVIYFC